MKLRAAAYVRVSTDDQRDNGYSIDSQIRMIKEYCERKDYEIVYLYNDAGYSAKDLIRPNMQKLLKDIKAKKIDVLVAIKVDRLTRNNYDGFWLLNYCQNNDVKLELTLESYDVSSANGEMMYGINLVYGQRERKEIGARTKRGLEEMALEKVHPNKAPYGYIRNKETGHLEIDPVESQVVKDIFALYKDGKSIRDIASIMKENNRFLKHGKWRSDRIYKILTNSIYIGTYAFGKYRRKKQDILYVNDYCEPIIDEITWKVTRINLDKNKHPNYGEHIHLFTSLVKCPLCGNILSSSIAYKNSNTNHKKEYYYLTCKNNNCKGKGYHYSSDKLEQSLSRILNELTRYMYQNEYEIMISTKTNSKELKDIDKAIEKLKKDETKLLDLYISSNIDVEIINNKNNMLKKELEKLNDKKAKINPSNRETTIELLKKLDCKIDNNEVLFFNNLGFSFLWNSLNRQAKKEILNHFISSIEIKRDDNYNIEVTNISFTEEFINHNHSTYIEYLKEILYNNDIGFKYMAEINNEELQKLSKDYEVYSTNKFNNNEYNQEEINHFYQILKEHFYRDGIISCPLLSDKSIIDNLILIPKTTIKI